ncbi:MAG: hypothetical protein ACKPEA_07270 [Planctomycetota bacterium]
MHTVTHTGAAPESAGTHHAVIVLLGHMRARLIYLDDAPVDGGVIETEWSTRQFRAHDRHASGGSGRPRRDQDDYFTAVADAAGRAERVVLAGCGSAKAEFVLWAHERRHPVAQRIRSVETVDRPSDGELVALAREALHAEPPRMVWPHTETL